VTIKLVAMATSLEPSENVGQIGNLRSNIYHVVKKLVEIASVDPDNSLLKCLFLKKKLTQAEHIASMPCRFCASLYVQSINRFICPETQDTGPDTKGGYNLHLQLPVKTM